MEERRAGDADSGWVRKADEVRRINHAVKVFNGIYEELYNMVNDAYVRNGYEKMGRRKNYFPHFQEEESNLFENFARRLGFGAGKYALPTSIDGLTETFSPGRNYNKHAEHRLGTDTAFDAIAGFEDYIDSATKAAYLTDDIKRLRQLEREIRAGEQIGTLTSRTKLSKANGDFGSLAKWVHEYANLVAGKKSSLDRGVENVVGRRVYQVLDPITAGEAGISAGREAADEGGAWKGLWAGLGAAWGEISGNLPYISGGRIGTNLIGDAIDAVGTIKDAAEEGSSARAWDTAFWQMMNYITYGGQIKKLSGRGRAAGGRRVQQKRAADVPGGRVGHVDARANAYIRQELDPICAHVLRRGAAGADGGQYDEISAIGRRRHEPGRGV